MAWENATALHLDEAPASTIIRVGDAVVTKVPTRSAKRCRERHITDKWQGEQAMDEKHDGSELVQAPEDVWAAQTTRKSFLKGAAVAGAGATGLGALAPAAAFARAKGKHGGHGGLTHDDLEILKAAQIAEALAVTTYTNIINTAPFFKNLEADDQGYLKAAVQEEMSHYLLEEGLTKKPSPFTMFYYPPKMFADAQTTLNILVTLEDAFIAAYLVGVRQFSTPDLRVTAARIMGIESDHRTLARVVGPNVASKDGGPIEQITGIQKTAESVDPPNNNGYERTLLLKNIGQAVEALLPFADKKAAEKAGFDVTKPYKFEPFKPTLASPLGEFHSLKG
jgi:Ferritin-like domain